MGVSIAQQLAVALCISCPDRSSGGFKYDEFYGPSQQPAMRFLLSNFPFSICVTSAVTLFLLTPPRSLFPCLTLFAIVYLHPNPSLLGECGLSLLKPSKWLPSFRFVRIHSFYYRHPERSEIWNCPGGRYDVGVFWDMAPCLLVSSNPYFRSWSSRQHASRNVGNFCTSSTLKNWNSRFRRNVGACPRRRRS